MKKDNIPSHFMDHLGKIRQWIAGFEAAGGVGPANTDTLRQIQLWIREQENKRTK